MKNFETFFFIDAFLQNKVCNFVTYEIISCFFDYQADPQQVQELMVSSFKKEL